MELINSLGTRVSLLNDAQYPRFVSQPSNKYRNSNRRTRTSYEDAEYSLSSHQKSPSTPKHERLPSECSHSTVDTQSPATPDHICDLQEQRPMNCQLQNGFYDDKKLLHGSAKALSQRAGIGEQHPDDSHTNMKYLNAIPYRPPPPPLDLRTSRVSKPSKSASPEVDSAQPKKKNKFPCPEWRNGCTDLFTTSGHAARHGKKHSGEKNVLCPVCNKAFTRKDNMKQHQRTHESGRGSSSKRKHKDESCVKKTRHKQQQEVRQRQRSSSIGSVQMSLPSTEQLYDLPSSAPSHNAYRYPTPPTRASYQELPLRNPQLSQSYGSMGLSPPQPGSASSIKHRSSPSESQPLSAGLDALAIAASGIYYTDGIPSWEQR